MSDKEEDKEKEAVKVVGGFLIILWWLFWFMAIWIEEYRIKLIISGLFFLAIVILMVWRFQD